jgi:TonB family protein
LEQEIRTIYEGNAHHGWMKPKILGYSDPESVNAPLDHFLNCMNEIEPLYTTAFQGDSQILLIPLKAGASGGQAAGDLDGYFVYDGGGFRFIPRDILMKLPNERPVRISLDMKIMESKLIDKAPVRMPAEAIKKRISGRVVVELILDVGGNTKELKVVEGDPILAAAVQAAVKQWRFAPTQLDGDPVEVDLRVPFTFTIN